MNGLDLYESAVLWLSVNPERSHDMLLAVMDRPEIYGTFDYEKLNNGLGVALTRMRPFRGVECERRFYEAYKANSNNPENISNLAYCHMMRGEPDIAHMYAKECVNKFPDHEDGWVKLFNSLVHQGKYFEAYGVQLKSMMRFNNPMNRRNLGLTELTLSNMQYEGMYRLGLKSWKSRHPELGVILENPVKDFSFKNCKGLRIFLEQGLGDCVMMIPYLRHAIKAVGDAPVQIVSIDHDAALECYRLFVWPDNVTFHKKGQPLPVLGGEDMFMFDLLECGMPDQICSQESQVRNIGYKTGICWRGNPSHPNDYWRSIPFDDLKPLLKEHGPNLVNLQSNLPPDELAYLKECGVEINPGIVKYDTLLDVMMNLKQVLTVDTFISHFAGSHSIQCATMLPVFVDWRWGMDHSRTPWYPNHTLIRQKECCNWRSVLEECAGLI